MKRVYGWMEDCGYKLGGFFIKFDDGHYEEDNMVYVVLEDPAVHGPERAAMYGLEFVGEVKLS